MIQNGIIAKADKENRTAGRHIRIVDEYGRARLETRTVGEMPDADLASGILADKLFPRDNSVNNRAFREIAANFAIFDFAFYPDNCIGKSARVRFGHIDNFIRVALRSLFPYAGKFGKLVDKLSDRFNENLHRL